MSTASCQGSISPLEAPLGRSPKRPLATFSLLLLNVLPFLAMVFSGRHLLTFGADQVLRWGGNYGPLTLDGQWWRLLSAMFVHVGLLHLAINMWALYELGTLAEQIYGGRTTLWLYLVTGVAGSIASLLRRPLIVSAGASGAIFGLAGALIATLALGRLVMRSRGLMIALASLLAFAGYNLSYGFLKGGIDNGAHVGGLVCGLMLGTVLSAGLGEERKSTSDRRYYVFSVAVLLLVVAFSVARQIRGQAAAIQSARQALQLGDPDLAIRRLGFAKKDSPAEYYSLLASAYAQKNQYDRAASYFQKALQLNPNDSAAHSGLGMVLVRSGRLEEGRKQLEETVKLDAKAGGAWLQLGLLWQHQGNYPESVTCLQKAAALDPGSAATQFALGISQMNLRQYDGAIAAFQKTTQLSPNNYSAFIWLGNAYEARGLTAQADAAYARAQQLRRPATRARK